MPSFLTLFRAHDMSQHRRVARPQQQSYAHPREVEEVVYYTKDGRPVERERIMRDRRGRERIYREEPAYLVPYKNEAVAPLTSIQSNKPLGRPYTAPQKQPEVYEQSYDGGYGDEEYDEEYDYGVEEGDFYGDEQQTGEEQYEEQQVDEVAMNTNPYYAELEARHAPFSNLSPEDLLKTANVKWDTIEYEVEHAFRPRALLTKEGELKGDGSFSFSVENGYLVARSASNEDDIPLDRFKLQKMENDLVQSIEVSIRSDFPKKLVLSFPTVRKIGKEYFRGESHVCRTIDEGLLNMAKPVDFAFKRDINMGIIAFTHTYDGTSTSTEHLAADIVRMNQRGRLGDCIVPIDHVIVHYFNNDPVNISKKITQVDLLPNMGKNIVMSKDVVDKYLKIAEENIGNKVSLGNVTSNMIVKLSVPEPPASVMARERFNAAQKQHTGKKLAAPPAQWKGFAEYRHVLGVNASDESIKQYLDTPIPFHMVVSVKYIKLDGREIVLEK